jgi:uncharacterized protein
MDTLTMSELIGREEEQATFRQMLSSRKSEFYALYGRRRIGKTYIVREFFSKQDCVFFQSVGIKDEKLKIQISAFTKEIGNTFYSQAELKPQDNWMNVFEQLTKGIELIPKNKKVVLFFDEFPWMATKRSKLLEALDYYWNRYWVNDRRLKLIICGSSTSWILKKILNSRGGFHNRVTGTMLLEPFTLAESRKYLNSMGIQLNQKQILQIYMVTGGIPHYLSYIKKGLSASQNIEALAFSKNGLLQSEFNKLFASLFEHSEVHEELMEVIASHRYGIEQAELIRKTKRASSGGRISEKLRELEQAGFIISFIPYGHKQKGMYYRAIDEYILFYFRWIKPTTVTIQKQDRTKGFWDLQYNTPAWRSWSGYAFESICYKHISQIRKALNINAGAVVGSWRYAPRKGNEEMGAQIDILFDRNDGVVTVCEIKHTEEPFPIDKHYAKKLLNKVEVYRKQTKIDKQIFIAFIATNGLKATLYSEELVTGVVTLENLFNES